MNSFESAPNDSRYVPLSQQPYLCVPTSIQMVMAKHNIPLIPAEEIGYQLGLTVPPEDAKYFYNVRTSENPPVASGYGTQVQTPEYEPNGAFERLHVPLGFSTKLSSSIESTEAMLDELNRIEAENGDALLCFNPGVLYNGQYEPDTGHVVIFDRVVDQEVRIVDPGAKNRKWRLVAPSTLFDAIKQHGDQNVGGIWYLKPTTNS